MRNLITSLIAGVLTFLFIACSEENSTVFPVEGSVENISSSLQKIETSSSSIFSSNTAISSSSWEPYSYGELIDERDGHIYKTIKIGEQTWMAENLNFDYHNKNAQYPALAPPSWCFNNSLDSCAKYGRLYLWSAAMDSAALFSKSGKNCGIWRNNKVGLCKKVLYNYARGACPESWHVPTESDINNIINYADISSENRDWLNHYWLYGENEKKLYGLLSQYGYFWSSLEVDSGKTVVLNVNNDKINLTDELKQKTYFIRCVKDSLSLFNIEHGELKDERDGQVYKTVRIGNQWWMAENLNYDYSLLFNSSDTISWCYNNDPDNCTKYGRLYLWIAAMNCEHEVEKFYNIEADDPYLYLSIMGACYDPVKVLTPLRGICPENWHVPSYDEWVELQNTVNNFAIDLKSTTDWLNDGNGSNVLGFNALPAGEVQYYYPEKFFGIEEKACFWTTQQFYGEIRSEGEWIEDYTNIFCFTAKSKEISKKEIEKYDLGLSLRCVRDSTSKE